MSQLLHDRRVPPYYERPPVPAMSLAPAHISHWPQFYTELSPQPSSFTGYLPAAQISVPQSPSYTVSWPNTATSGPSHLQQNVIVPRSSATGPDPHSLTHQQSLLSDFRATSQRAALSCSPRLVQQDTVASYAFELDRVRSPSSHASASDFGASEREDVRAWDGSSSSLEEIGFSTTDIGELGVTGSSIASERADEYTESSRSGSRHSSVPVSITASTSSSSRTSVKVEPEDLDGRFIMELSAFRSPSSGQASSSTASTSSLTAVAYNSSLLSQALAPPTEVPLRATQASKEMRRMMGVFRLNPFAMHSLSMGTNGDGDDYNGLGSPTSAGAAPWCGGEARPLEEEPVMLEFQLDIVGLDEVDQDGVERVASPFPSLEAKAEVELRSFSPSFQLHHDDVDIDAQAHSCDSRDAEAENRQDIQSCRGSEYGQGQDGRPGVWEEDNSGSHPDMISTTTRLVPASFAEVANVSLRQPEAQHGYVPQVPSSSLRRLPSPSLWDAITEDYRRQAEGVSDREMSAPAISKADFAHQRVAKLHATTSHPYLRRGSLQHHPTPVQPSHATFETRLSPRPIPMHASPATMLLNMPTHHSQPHTEANQYHHQPHATIENNHFHPPQHIRPPHPSHLALYGGGLVPTLTDTVSTVDTFDRASAFKQPSSSYMRLERGLQDHRASQDGRNAAHGTIIVTNSAQAGGYAPSPDEVSMVFGSTTETLHRHPGTFTFAAAANARRWSLPETSVTLANGRLEGNV
ncbi:unnamed protein product [Cyclocybe aegerita]|uniref:Uncharacterized protein n=1 Tax=Cyclocybe aegerita TaxID=1973307 RepID=A0A8S0W643_CYCAE|nr:unnamed protein product [Cyclocybe aegerita]